MQQSLTSILSLFQKGEATGAGMTFVGRKKEAAQSFLSFSIEKIKVRSRIKGLWHSCATLR
jgi:hypothetical protein